MEKTMGVWSLAEKGPVRELALDWTGPNEAVFDPTPGWKAPLWRVRDGALELLRPQGLWRADLGGRQATFVAFERGARGWCSRRGVQIDPQAPPAWRAQFGERSDPERLDRAMEPPARLVERVDASGELAKWELTDEGRALAWLDDAFERGPLSCARAEEFLIVSNGERKVAYDVGTSHWSWAMVERGLLSVRLGRGGGWEPEREINPILL